LVDTFVGPTFKPYVPDHTRLNDPWGIATAPDGNVFVTEQRGYRLVKLNADGVQQWTVGEAGVYGNDDNHFGSFWAGPQGNVAVDSSGQVFVPDTANHRVQIFTSGGTLAGSFGYYGTGNYQFDCPAGVAISPVNGDIYVVDRCNQRVQVFDSSRIYKATLGETDVPDTDNTHFNWPWGVAVDASGNIYVADSDNHRIQKCTLTGISGTCSTFAGETGTFSDSFDHFHPLSVAVDAVGRVYVVDEWNNRVQVFDSSGTYLTTIGGQWGTRTGEMRGPAGVAVDGSGNVYVADRVNHRIQKFTPGVPGWVQTNINGFGDRDNAIPSLATFDGHLYVGSWNIGGGDAEVWRTADGQTWDEVTPQWSSQVGAVYDIEPFGSHLYLGTANISGEIWRTDGTTWEQVVSDGFGDSNNDGVNALATYNGALYAATSNDTSGVEIWRSVTGNSGTWTQVNSDGFGGGPTWQDLTMETFGTHLYVGLGRNDIAELWRTDGTTWTSIFLDGMGDPDNTNVSSFDEFQSDLYIGLRNVEDGGEVWRSTDGLNWNSVIAGGLGNVDNGRPYGMITYGNNLYLVFSNLETGVEVWRSTDGSQWVQIGENGWGDSKNGFADYFDKGAAVFNGNLYIGVFNFANGAQIWQSTASAEVPLQNIYLPIILRDQ
ncbi:MAG: SMP-30/gluconolactonase/LRE family protein, partial [Anaerolineales bacterium]